MSTNVLFENGFYQANITPFKSNLLQKALKDFIVQPMSYKQQFLQKEFTHAFDGYSFLGQKDSSNQYETDLLHSFVISEFHSKEKFPQEFQQFFEDDWNRLKAKITQIELQLLKKLNISGLANLYQSTMGHMISCNYYPPLTHVKTPAAERLSAHTDVSLFTVFPFGFDADFCFELDGEWQTISATQDMIVFPGYLLEVLTNGKIKALNHKVKTPKNLHKERFSFAYFSIPHRAKHLNLGTVNLTSEAYFKQYLALFD